MPGWKVFTVGDDIAWLNFDEQGQLRAINPEAGYFGVVPGTNSLTNRNAYEIIKHDTIFTNVALTADGEPWWEGRRQGQPTVDWKGQPWDGKSHAAHPNSRFTVAARQNPCYAPEADDPRGVPISALIFGGRRKEVAPLVFQAKSWRHGVLVAAGVASETTAAAAGQVGVVRRDSMAMKPFCGYNFGDYFAHWLRMGERRGVKLPEVFHVNWFRQGPDGKFLWPGFGENLRVVEWILDRCEGRGEAVETPIGFMPTRTALDLDGLDLPSESLDKLLSIDRDQWRREIADIGAYLEEFGDRTPSALRDEVARVAAGLS
jgi:phosphoenolpyruvate carboxykinase (GTP)